MRFTVLLVAGLVGAQFAAWAQPQPPGPPPAPGDTVTITRAEFEEWKATVKKLQETVQQLQAQVGQPAAPAPAGIAPPGAPPPPSGPGAAGAPPPPPPSEPAAAPTAVAAPGGPPSGAPAPPGSAAAPKEEAAAGRHYLSLPDISLVVQSVGVLSTDQRDANRNRVFEREAEIGIQGWVYPNVKADCFITMDPSQGEAANVEEAYLTYLGLKPGLNLQVGRKHVPFDRQNLLHNHSWLYINPPKVLTNLVATESLEGDGLNLSYVLPTRGNFFAQLDLGTWTADPPVLPSDVTTPPALMVGPGANFSDKFSTARLWTSSALSSTSELEVGGSYAQGPTAGLVNMGDGTAALSGVDVTYRHFGEGTARLLLRGEEVWRRETVDGMGTTASGYYLFGNLRNDKYASWGLLYDWSEFPQAPTLHESALSLIYTKQLSEQYYLRLEGTHGSRPGDANYNEMQLQWCWGVGPHTHNLE